MNTTREGAHGDEAQDQARHTDWLGGSVTGPFFHGGVPGANVGAVRLSAAEIGAAFQYSSPNAPYDPSWVYVTSDLGVARAYASRYLSPRGGRVPGDVYEVDPGSRSSPTPTSRPSEPCTRDVAAHASLESWNAGSR